MKIEIAAITDASKEYGSRLNLLGVFDSFFAPAFPFTIDYLDIVVRIRFDLPDGTSHQVSVSLMDADGSRIIGDVGITTNVGFGSFSTVAANIILRLHAIRFPSAGEYSLDISINGQSQMSLPLFCIKSVTA